MDLNKNNSLSGRLGKPGNLFKEINNSSAPNKSNDKASSIFIFKKLKKID